MSVQDWFLPVGGRGNPATRIDQRHADGNAWTAGNDVRVLVHGSEYFPRLYAELCSLQRNDWIHFTDWRGDPDERLNGPGTEIARVLADCARRGVHVRGLVWRSHADQAHFSEEENLHLVETVNEAGGEVLLDERVRSAGSHHQKLFLIRRPADPDNDVAFVGGIDLCHGRNDTDAHLGDPQAIELDDRYGPTPAWHDVQIEVRGPAVGDLAHTFRERWEDPTPIDHRNPVRARLARVAHEPKRPDPMPPMPPDPAPRGHCSIQVVRTYAARRPRYPFAPDGERSVARTYQRVFRRAQRLIYLEDQYLWLEEAADALVAALERAPRLRVVAVVPRFPDRDGRISGPPYRIGQQRVFERIARAARRALHGLRPREHRRSPHLRALEGLCHRRRVDDRRFGQPEPAFMDERFGALVRHRRRTARRSRTPRSRRSRRRRARVAPRNAPPAMAGALATRR